PDARMAIVEDRLDRIEKKRDQADEKLDRILEQITDIKGDLKWHRIAGIAVVAVYTGIFSWFVFSYIPEKLIDRVPTDLKEKIATLETKVANLQDQLKKLTPASLDQLIPTPNQVASKNTVVTNLNKAARVIDTAFRIMLPAQPEAISPLRSRVSQII